MIEELEEMTCMLLGGTPVKLHCAKCVVEGCSESIEARNEEVGVAS